jgi:hypothetical protein
MCFIAKFSGIFFEKFQEFAKKMHQNPRDDAAPVVADHGGAATQLLDQLPDILGDQVHTVVGDGARLVRLVVACVVGGKYSIFFEF